MEFTPSHVGGCGSDLERSMRFYWDGLGFERKERYDITAAPSSTTRDPAAARSCCSLQIPMAPGRADGPGTAGRKRAFVTTMSELVTYTLAGEVASIVMDDGKANALSIAMLTELHAAFDQAERDGAVAVLAGRDGRFSGGFHLPTLRARGEEADTTLRSGFDLAVRILTFPRPVVIACTGHAVAQGAILLCG